MDIISRLSIADQVEIRFRFGVGLGRVKDFYSDNSLSTILHYHFIFEEKKPGTTVSRHFSSVLSAHNKKGNI